MPRWVVPATIVFWTGALAALAVRVFWSKLSDLVILVLMSLFLSLAIEPGVNRLSRRGWRRGSATALLLFGVLLAFLLFFAAIGTLVGSQIAELLTNTERYITRHRQLPQRCVRVQHRRPGGDRGLQRSGRRGAAVHRRPAGQRGAPLRRRAQRAAAAVLGDVVHVLPRRRRTRAAPGDLQPAHSSPAGAGAAHVGAGGDEDRRLPLLAGAAGAALDAVPLDRVPIDRHGRSDRAGAVGRHREPVPPGGRHVSRRRSAVADHVPRFAAEGTRRADRHRRLSADRELRPLAPHHRPHHGAAPGARVRCRTGRCRAPRRRRGGPRPAGRGDGAGAALGAGFPPRGRRERAHGRHQSPMAAAAGVDGRTRRAARFEGATTDPSATTERRDGDERRRTDRRDDAQRSGRVDPPRRRRRRCCRRIDRLLGGRPGDGGLPALVAEAATGPGPRRVRPRARDGPARGGVRKPWRRADPPRRP